MRIFHYNFWLFPKLTGCRYETIEEMKEAVTKVIDTLTQEDFHGAFQKLLFFYWSLSDSKSPRLSRSLLAILADLNNAVFWMVSTRPLISKSSSPCTNPLVTMQSAPITISIIHTFMFHSFFSVL